MATHQQRAFNKGLRDFDARRTARPGSAVVEPCPEAACGLGVDLDDSDPQLTGWVYARMAGSTEPGRWYCSPACCARGVALVQLRLPQEGT